MLEVETKVDPIILCIPTILLLQVVYQLAQFS